MPDYQKMYHTLFNEITDIIEQLQSVQIKTEELYINSKGTSLKIMQEIEPENCENYVVSQNANHEKVK